MYGGLSAQYFALNSIGSDAAYAGVWNVELSSDPLQPVATYNGARRPHLISHIDYIRVENGFLDVADWSWQESQLRVERIQLGTNESVYESRLFLAENCPEVSHDAGLFTELYTWACGTPGRDYGWTLPFPDRAYQNGENNALIWIRQ